MKFTLKKYNSKNIDKTINNFLLNNNKSNKRLFLDSVKKIKKNYLNSKAGMYFFRTSKKNISNLKLNTIIIGKSLGPLVKQNKKGSKIISVETKKTKVKNLRYHQTNTEGSIHTDGPQLNYPPNTIILACEKNASQGGETILSFADKIQNYLKKNKKNIYKTLTKKYLFERKGFNGSTIYKPIYLKSKKTYFRFIREYINDGYKLRKKNMPKEKLIALNFLEMLMKKKENTLKFKLKSGDVIIINNFKRAHGRKKFIKSAKSKRKLYRVWIKS